MTDHGFVGGNWQALHTVSEYGRAIQIFHLVVFGRASAMRVNIVDIIRGKPGIANRVCYTSDDRLAIGARTRTVESVRHLAAAFEHAKDFGSACFRSIIALKHQCASTFSHHEAIAIL